MPEKGKKYNVNDEVLQRIIDHEDPDGLLVQLKLHLHAQRFSDASGAKKYAAIINFVLEDKFGMTQEEIDKWLKENR